MPDIIIRPATKTDLPAVGQLGAQLLRVHYEFDRDRFMQPGDDSEEGYAWFLGVQLGESDAGFVYRSDVTPASRHVHVLEIPDERNVIARYPMTILKDARNAEAARWFFDLVLSAEGQKVLQRHGLMPAETAPRAPATP